eukprot:TRINITY_DN1177_c0_g1_i1.p1 TRINITY_DN1177_c0_g1~~TRINITY_DN1177_c0_g1_i1.p1  ORF type:complete len:430 (-),score=112.28 TRINITY_DN1177_c0_g1_i1:35-1324(-)
MAWGPKPTQAKVNFSQILEEESKLPKSEKILRIFDFDGTLFRSPVPNESLWHPKLYNLIRQAPKQGGVGWYQEVITLMHPCVPEKIDATWFHPEMLELVKTSMADPNCATVLLTGRAIEYTDIILNFLKNVGLEFDDMGLKPAQQLTTMDFKLEFIDKMIKKYHPVRVEMFDDRPNHCTEFEAHLSKNKHIQSSVRYIEAIETVLDEDVEQEVVQQLLQKHRPNTSLKTSVRYTGAVLDHEGHRLLLERFSPPDPSWRPYAHHCTIKLGSIRGEEEELGLKLGDVVKFEAIAVGASDFAMAVQVRGITSRNATPHITLYVSPDGKPFMSNDIREWKELESPILLSATIKEFVQVSIDEPQRSNPRSPSKNQPKVDVASLVTKTFPSADKKDIGATIKRTFQFLSEKGLSPTEDNLDQIETFLKNLDLNK